MARGMSVQLLLQNDESSHATRNASVVLAALRRPREIADQLLRLSAGIPIVGWNIDFEPWPHSHDPAHGTLYAHFLRTLRGLLSAHGQSTVTVCANNWTSLFSNYAQLASAADTVFDMSTYHAESPSDFTRNLRKAADQFSQRNLPKLASGLAMYNRFAFEADPASVGIRFAAITRARISHVALFAFPMSHGLDPWSGSNATMREAWWDRVMMGS